MWRRVSCPAPEPALGIASPQACETPRRGGLADGTAQEFVGPFVGARGPALRSAGLFGSETGSPRARYRALLGIWHLVAGVVGGPNPACGPHAKKSLRPRRKRKKEKGPFRRAPSRLKLQQRAKKTAKSIALRGWSEGRTRPADLTPKEARGRLCPAGVQPQKKSPAGAPGLSSAARKSGVGLPGRFLFLAAFS